MPKKNQEVEETAVEETTPEVVEETTEDVAEEATEEKTDLTEEAPEESTEQVAEEVVEVERKHKNRESTSEKAKKAAAARAAAGEQPVAEKVQLDPLRLRGKKYRAAVAEVDKNKLYPAAEALDLAVKTSYTKFVGAVELHVKVKNDAVRGTITLPHGNGKTKKVAVATDEVIESIAAGKIAFDVLLATPAQMPKLAKFAKVLGPKGLMPSPKAGTVTDDIEKATAEISGGRFEYRADKNGVVHVSIGRTNFPVDHLLENYQAIIQLLVSNKIISVAVSSTMGPGVKIAF